MNITKYDINRAKALIEDKLDTIAEFECPFLYIPSLITETLNELYLDDVFGDGSIRDKLYSHSIKWFKNVYGDFH